ncbi:hypothetical protein ACJ73_10244, partial [Blastomyces percursus]
FKSSLHLPPLRGSHSNPPFRPFELIAMEDETKYISITQILDRLNVHVDTAFESDSDLSAEYEGKDQYFLRQVMRTKTGVVEVWPYCKSSPIRAELEIAAHGRDLLEKIFCSDIQVISLPYQLFIDGFGLYRNMYRSLMGFYMIPALSAVERSKRNNIFSLTFGPHSTNFPDTIAALSHGLSTLDCKGYSGYRRRKAMQESKGKPREDHAEAALSMTRIGRIWTTIYAITADFTIICNIFGR